MDARTPTIVAVALLAVAGCKTEEGTPGPSKTTESNAPPSVRSVQIAPNPATSSDALSCEAVGVTDPDGDEVSLSYAWSVDGVVDPSSGPALPASATSRDSEVICTVTPTDGTGEGQPVSSEPLVIGNTPPVVQAVTLTPDPASTADAILCTATTGSDPDGDTLSLTHAWTVDGAPVAETADTLPSSATTRGTEVVCTVTADDGLEASAPVASSPLVVTNSAPAATVSIAPTTPSTTDDLVATPGATDADGDPVSYTFQWFEDGVPLAGETLATLAASATARDRVYAVEVVGNDGIDDGPVATADVTVENSAPSAPVVQILPSQPEAAVDDLVCEVRTASVDRDGDPVSYTVGWTVDTVPFTGTTTTTLPGDTVPATAPTVDAERWECTITPDDGAVAGAAGVDSVLIGGGGGSGSEPYHVLLTTCGAFTEIETPLLSWGYTVTPIDDVDLDATFDYSAYDVVALCQGRNLTDGGHLAMENARGNIGVVMMSSNDNVFAAMDFGSTTYVHQTGLMTVLDPSHFITQGYSGDVDLGYHYKSRLTYPGPNVDVLADGDDGAMLAVHRSYRRVLTPFYGHTVAMPWDPPGEEITRRSFRWAAGEGGL